MVTRYKEVCYDDVFFQSNKLSARWHAIRITGLQGRVSIAQQDGQGDQMRATFLILITIVPLAGPMSAVTNGSDGASPTSTSEGDYCFYESGGWRIWQTENFRICTLDANLELNKLPAKCEELKVQVETAWFKGSRRGTWQPRCDVIVHRSLDAYQRALGRGVGTSAGCATMQYDSGQVVSRRVDIRVDADDWRANALPHELTHVVLAAGLGNRRLPPWLDEGVGVLSESSGKRMDRATAYEEARERNTVFSTPELIQLRTFPRPEYRDAFYVQSAALVRLLRDRGGADRFARFANLAVTSNVDRALRETYKIDGMTALERLVRGTETSDLVMKGMLPEPEPHSTLVADAEE